MKRLVFFVGVYDTLDIFTYELKKEFEELAYETMLFDVQNMQESLSALASFITKPVKAVITFNNLGFNMELHPGKNLWEELQIPCVNILMDHPFCYHNSLKDAPANGIVLCSDRIHMKYLERFYPNIPIVGYLPHAGKEISTEKKPLEERTIDVLYAGNLSKSFAANIVPDFSKYQEFNAEEICRIAYENLIEHPWKTTEQALEECFAEKGLVYEDSHLRELIADLHFVDLYAVSYYREMTVRVLAESGIKITLYGAGWENCDWITKPNVFYGGKISADEVVKKMQDSKIVLSTMTWFKDGTHDRVFNGMLQGAVAVSDTSRYMKEEFRGDKSDKECQEMLLFELDEIQQLPNRIKDLLSNMDTAQKIANRGYEKAKAYHTWKVRAEELERDLLNSI